MSGAEMQSKTPVPGPQVTTYLLLRALDTWRRPLALWLERYTPQVHLITYRTVHRPQQKQDGEKKPRIKSRRDVDGAVYCTEGDQFLGEMGSWEPLSVLHTKSIGIS